MDAPALGTSAPRTARPTPATPQSHAELVEDLPQRLAERPRSAARRSRAARHVERGKLLPRDRVDTLLDPGSPFLELSPLAANGTVRRRGAGRRASSPAIGRVVRPRVRGRRQRRHRQGRHVLPDDGQEAPARPGGGAAQPAAVRLPGRLRRRVPAAGRTRSSPTASTSAGSSTTRPRCPRAGIPQIAAVLGSCTAGGAYVPAMSDEAVIVRDQGTIFLGGPPLVKAATGEVVTAEELGGGDAALAHLRRHRPPRRRRRARAAHRPHDRRHARPARARARGTCGRPRSRPSTPPSSTASCPTDPRTPYDVREVIARIVDGSRFARVQGGVRHDAGHRVRPDPRPPGRHRRQQRHPVRRVRA